MKATVLSRDDILLTCEMFLFVKDSVRSEV